MSAPKVSSPNWFLRLAILAVVAAAIYFGITYVLQPVVMVAAAETGTAVRTVPGTVEVKAEFAIELKSEVAGRVITSSLDVGKRVFRNDVLVQIDTGDVDLEIERIKNEIIAAKRKVELGSTLRPEVLNSKDTLVDFERRTKDGGFPPSEFEKMKRLHGQLEQKMELDEVQLRLLLENYQNSLRSKEREKAKMTITAPSDGIVTTVTTRVGDLIGSNSAIASIIAVSRTVEAKISEENFAAIKLGQKATVRFLTFGADQYNAVVSKILPAADPTTQRYSLFLDISLPEGRVLLPGLTGEVQIIIAERANAITIPRRALVGDFVYVAEAGRLIRRKITKGYESMNQVEILTGLAKGDQVVVEQQDRYREGERVRTQVVPN